MKAAAGVAVAALLLGGAAACGKVQAHTPVPAGPALETPAPPQRIVIPAPIPDPEPPPAPAATPPATSPARPATQVARPPERSTPPTTPPEMPPPTQPVLQTTPDVGQAEVRTRGLLADADRDLNHVDYRTLSPNLRDQYDQARRFIALANNALKTQNVVYAGELARKAAALASQLVRR